MAFAKEEVEMNPDESRKKPFIVRTLVKALCLLALIVAAQQVFAGCDEDRNNGWRIDSVCNAHFDWDGNFTGAFCDPDYNSDPNSPYAIECKQDYDGATAVCYGSNCEFDDSDPGGGGTCHDSLDCPFMYICWQGRCE